MFRMAEVHKPSAAAAGGTSLITVLATIYSAFFPDRAGDAAAALLPPMPEYIGAEFVAAQVTAFVVAMLMLAVLTAIGLLGTYYYFADRQARALAMGQQPNGRPLFFMVAIPVVLCIILSIHVPPVIFEPTNLDELQRQLALGAWAARSGLGGLAVAMIVLGVAGVLAVLGWLTVIVLPRRLARSRYQRVLDK